MQKLRNIIFHQCFARIDDAILIDTEGAAHPPPLAHPFAPFT
jgi:hypothetical protein